MILTMAVAGALVPPKPVHSSVYAAGIVNAPVLMLPLVGWAPLQPPLAVHEVAFVELHVNIEALPLAIDPGMAVRDAVGTGGGTGGGAEEWPPPHAASDSSSAGRK
jgi:hypothetical protein